MESIGQVLKAARERRQISIADVAVATKMTSTFVKAIEADEFNVLVAPVYARGFIKLYAECVGLDPMPLLKQFDAAHRAAPVLAPPPAKAPPGKQAKSGGRPMAVGGTAPASAAPLLAGARALINSRLPRWLASLRAERLSALSRLFSARARWPRLKLPGWLFPFLALPAMVWRRIFIVALVVLLIIAAGLAWEWSRRSMPFMTDACRWLSEPPAPYLGVDVRPATSSR